MMKRKNKIIVLWLLTMGGFASHTLLDLLPLFWGQDIAFTDSPAGMQGMILMMAALGFLIPVGGVSCLLAGKAKILKVANAALAVLIALFNVAHAAMELPSDNVGQYVVMPLMMAIGIWLAWLSVAFVVDKHA